VREKAAENRLAEDENIEKEQIRELVNRYIYETQFNRDPLAANGTDGPSNVPSSSNHRTNLLTR